MARKNFRDMFKSIFGVEKQNIEKLEQFRQLNTFNPIFYTKDVANNDIVNACIDTIARHCSKFEIVHKKYANDDVAKVNGNIAYILEHRPNPIMNTSQFLYKIVSNLMYQNNSFVYIAKDSTNMITGFYPITATSYELEQDQSGTIYLKFNFANGKTYQLPYSELIHIKRFYNKGDIFGNNTNSLSMAVNSSNTAIQGIDNAIKSTSAMRGLIKFTSGMLKPEDMKKIKDDFVRDYMNLENASGIAVMDTKTEFTPVSLNPITLGKDQLDYLDERILHYFGMNQAIISSKYSADEWNSFFESVLEPIAIQMEQEFTNKIFGDNAIRNGHRIVFNVDRIRYLNSATKISLIKEVGALGILTIDEARKILDLTTIGGEEGAKRLVSLNYVDSDIANDYQLGKGGEDNGK